MNARLRAIRYLASRDLQDRYIVGGTAAEYVLPQELVEDALTFVELVESGKAGRPLTSLRRELLHDLEVALIAVEPFVSGNVSNEDLVAKNREWAAVRGAAGRFLAAYEGGGD